MSAIMFFYSHYLIILQAIFVSDVYHVKEMKWEVRAKKRDADDAEIDGAYARSQDALRRKDIKHSNVGHPNIKNTKASKAAKRLRQRTGSGAAAAVDEASSSSDSSSAHAASSSETSSDSEDDDDLDDLQHIISLEAVVGEKEHEEQILRPTSSDAVPPSDRVTFRWRHRRFVSGEVHGGRLVFQCTCGLPSSKLHVCRHIIRVVHSIFGKHILDISFVHTRTMRLWYNFSVKGGAGALIAFNCERCCICEVTFFSDAKRIPSNWDELMNLNCVPSVLISPELWTNYVSRCQIEAAPEAESYRDQEADYDDGGDNGGDEGSDNSDWLQQYRNLGLQLLQACGRDQEMRKQILDHLEGMVTDVGLMSAEKSGATRESSARIRPFYERRQ